MRSKQVTCAYLYMYLFFLLLFLMIKYFCHYNVHYYTFLRILCYRAFFKRRNVSINVYVYIYLCLNCSMFFATRMKQLLCYLHYIKMSMVAWTVYNILCTSIIYYNSVIKVVLTVQYVSEK